MYHLRWSIDANENEFIIIIDEFQYIGCDSTQLHGGVLVTCMSVPTIRARLDALNSTLIVSLQEPFNGMNPFGNG
jgi:hypothetical protein